MTKRKQRGHNEGSIYQRKDGRWVAAVTLDATGKRKSFYGATRKNVSEQLKIALREQQQGLPVAVERQTVAQFLDCWLTDVVKGSVRPKTYHSYAQLVRLHLVPAVGHHQLAKLTPQHVQQFMNDKRSAGLSPRTVQYLRAVLRRALGQALKWGVVARNVATLVEPPKSKRHDIAFLSPEQARALQRAAKGDRLEALYTVALAMGLRQGEALGLRWHDVDLDAGTLTVRHALQRIGGELRFVEPKTATSCRRLAMPSTVTAALREHRIRQLQERLLAGSRWQDHNLVFASTIGTPLDARNVVRHFKALLERAGLADMRWHDLRHSCASLMLAQGIDVRTIMETLGHSQISLTLNTYAHISQETQRRAAEAMDRVLTGTGH